MSPRALILTYHGIEHGPPPLFLRPALFRDHLDALLESGATPVSLDRLRDGNVPDRGVALTFDDGFLSVADEAAPLLAERGLPATIFCVAGHAGGLNDWPTQPRSVPRRRLADARTLAELAGAGFEIGSHGTQHAPLTGASEPVLRREVVDSRRSLEEAVGVPVGWFAYPYGVVGAPAARDLVEQTYDGACAGGTRAVRPGANPFALPRVDAHYLRSPRVLRRVLEGVDSYLWLRRSGARARRRLMGPPWT
jgi:peptidoglycan/xylan/chitin deacetylase (PgdA/CDA1 family)